MAKPIGNMSINVKSSDKVGFRTKAKFSGKAVQPGATPAEPPAKTGHAQKKYKTRKK